MACSALPGSHISRIGGWGPLRVWPENQALLFTPKKHSIAARFHTGEIEHADQVTVQVVYVAPIDVFLGLFCHFHVPSEVPYLVPIVERCD